jgi:hypothetical protein
MARNRIADTAPISELIFSPFEWDTILAQTLFPLLKDAPDKRYVLASREHQLMMKKNRFKLFESVQVFLDDAGWS